MTQEHPITPPEWLIEERSADWKYSFTDDAKFFARWGADQELEAVCELLSNRSPLTEKLRAARRPKPPSLKAQALETLRSMQIEPVILDGINVNKEVMDKYDIVRRALESLPD